MRLKPPARIPFSTIRTLTVGSGISPDLLTQAFSRARRSRTITAGGELHPALRTDLNLGSEAKKVKSSTMAHPCEKTQASDTNAHSAPVLISHM